MTKLQSIRLLHRSYSSSRGQHPETLVLSWGLSDNTEDNNNINFNNR